MKVIIIFYALFFNSYHSQAKNKSISEKDHTTLIEKFSKTLSSGIFYKIKEISNPFGQNSKEETESKICKLLSKKNCSKYKNVIKKTVRNNQQLLAKPESLSEHSKKAKIIFIKYQNKYKLVKLQNTRNILNILEKNKKSTYQELISYNATDKQITQNDFLQELSNEVVGTKYSYFVSSYITKLIKDGALQLEETDIINANQKVLKKLGSHIENIIQEKELNPKSAILFAKTVFHSKNPPKINHETQENILLKKLLQNHDLRRTPKIVDLILEKKYQRAIWNLRKKNLMNIANFIEDHIINISFNPQNIISVENFNLGFSKTYLASNNENLFGIYKPKVSPIKHPFSYISSNYKAEVAAFFMDRVLNLNMVPITIIAQYENYKLGSQQFFVKDAYRAREMSTYTGKRITKFGVTTGRAKKTDDMLFFDWLTDNWDRNTDNFLLMTDGGTALIDHGFSFVRRKSVKNISKKVLQSLNPNTNIKAKLQEINSNPAVLEPLKQFIGSKKVKRILGKIKSYLSQISSQV
jgi:hypothetical protein